MATARHAYLVAHRRRFLPLVLSGLAAAPIGGAAHASAIDDRSHRECSVPQRPRRSTTDAGEVVRLVKCNVDPRCDALPQP
jgi:hypothetical protein